MTSISHCSGGLVRQMAQTHFTPSQLRQCIINRQSNPRTSCSISANQQPVKRGPGRPRKNPRVEDLEEGSDGEYKPQRKPKTTTNDKHRGGPRGKRDHCK